MKFENVPVEWVANNKGKGWVKFINGFGEKYPADLKRLAVSQRAKLLGNLRRVAAMVERDGGLLAPPCFAAQYR